jgi:hypothetical protein
MIPVFIYAVVYNIPRFFEYRVDYNGCLSFSNGTRTSQEFDNSLNVSCENPYILDYTEMRKTQLYISVS